jgi:hypothetical protein
LIGAFSEASPARRRFIDTTSSSETLSRSRSRRPDRVQIAIFDGLDPALDLAQVEEQRF